MSTDITLTDEQKTVLNNGLNEIVRSKDRQQAEQDLQKEILEKLHSETKIEKKLLRKIANARFSGKSSAVIEEAEQVTFLIESL